MTTEPTDPGLTLEHEHGRSLWVRHRGRPLLRYVYEPWDAQRESPRPYFHPIRTLGGDEVSLYRPHDHVWHKGIAWSLPNVGPANFWGGPTYRRGRGYEQLPNNGSTRHVGFAALDADPDLVTVAEDLDWVTEQGERWFTERRTFAVGLVDGGWTLAFGTRFVNVADHEIVIGSPTTQGRDNAGYGGLFWRGPRSFSDGIVHVPDGTGGDELMGTRAPWLGYVGQHDGHGRRSTLVFADAPDNPGHPTKWFVRTGLFACAGPAPFFDTELPVAPGTTVTRRYAVAIADGDAGADGVPALAAAALTSLKTLQ